MAHLRQQVYLLGLLLVFITAPMICDTQYIEVRVSPHNPSEGEYASFRCRSHFPLGPLPDFTWSKDGVAIARNNDFLDEAFGNRTDVFLHYLHFRYESRLDIGIVSRSDSGIYTCRVDNEYFDDYIFYHDYGTGEQSVELNVLYYPSSEFPVCSVISDANSHLTFSCLSEMGNPVVSADWTVESDLVNEVHPTTNQTGGFVTSEIIIKSTQIRNMDVFICSLSSSNFDFTKNCSLYGHSIAYLLPTSSRVDAPDRAVFTCNIFLGPAEHVESIWVTKPEVPHSRRFVADLTLRIDPVLPEDNGTVIICYAFSDDQWVKADATLWVDYEPSLTTTPTTEERKISSAATTPTTGGSFGLEERKGSSATTALTGVLVVAIILLAVSIALNVVWYMKIKKATPSSTEGTLSPQKGKSEDKTDHVQGKTNAPTEGDTYMDLQPEGKPSEVYAGLKLDETETNPYVNEGFKGNETANKRSDLELYDYPEEMKDSRKKDANDEGQVYSNVYV